MTWTFLRPKRPDWFRRAEIAAIVVFAAYVAAAWWEPWAPGRLGGLIAGTAAVVIFVIDAMYPLRRRLLGWPFGSAQAWLQFHLYGGLIACALVWIHMGFRWPDGNFGWVLFLLTMWTTASGLLGVFLQKWIPTLIVNNLRVEALYERIPELVARLRDEADAVAANASEMLTRAYQSEIRPQLAAVAPSWGYLFDMSGSRARKMGPLQHVAQFLAEDEQARLDDLQAIFGEKTELDAHLSLQRALRLWIWLHVPPSMLLLGALAVHVAAVLYL
jgi:hypothetical protein